MKALSSYRLLPLARLGLPVGMVAVLGLTGCYTQLATRGYNAVEPPAAQTSAPVGDSLASDSALARGGAPAADTLAPRTGAPAVIVNNYYDAGPTYRGYAQWEWDYPLLSVGYYSSRFDRFSRPWWWDDPWYNHRRHHHHHHHHNSYSRPIVVTPRPQTPAGPYKSETRLYNPDPSYAPVRKGRRSQEPAAQPAQTQEPRQEAQPAPKSSSASSGSSSSGSGSQSSQDDSKSDDSHPTLKKGRRR